MGRKIYSESTLCLKKHCFCRKNIISVVAKTISVALRIGKIYFDSEKTTIVSLVSKKKSTKTYSLLRVRIELTTSAFLIL